MKNRRQTFLILLLATGCLAAAGLLPFDLLGGRIIYVSNDPLLGDYTTIQEAIDAALDGDAVVVRDGDYTGISNTDLDFHGKKITVRSENGPESCFIKGVKGAQRAFYFHSGETADSVVSGFTILMCSSAFTLESSSPTITHCRLEGREVDEGGGSPAFYSAGGIQCRGSSPILSDIVIQWDTKGIEAYESSSVTVNGGDFRGVYAPRGAIHVEDSFLSVRDVRIHESSYQGITASTGSLSVTNSRIHVNGPIHVSGCTLTIDRCFLSGGNTKSGIEALGSTGTVVDSTIAKNAVNEGYGGGILLVDSAIAVRRTQVRDNLGDLGGGGIYLLNSPSSRIEDCLIVNNRAPYGAGVLVNGCSPAITGSTFRRNFSFGTGSVAGSGSGIEIQSSCEGCNDASPILTNCNFTENHGAVVTARQGAAPVLTNCTLARNYGTAFTAASSASPVVTNCILWDNRPGEISADETSNPVVTYSDLTSSYAGEGNIQEDPELEGINLWLSAGSPCINSGTNSAPSIPSGDRGGNPRIAGGTVDMGSHEYNPAGPPIADFTVTPRLGPSPLRVQFQDASAGTVDAWAWDFGDGNTGSEQNPEHTFGFTGTYTVTLTVTGAGRSDTESKIGAVTVGRTWYVPDDNPTIQGMLWDTSDGDEVILRDGTYSGHGNREIYFDGKSITVRSENGPEHCIVDCEGAAPGFYFYGLENPDSVISGLTVRNCPSALVISSASPTIHNCVLQGSAAMEGGGIRCYYSNPMLTGLLITGNTADFGGGIFASQSAPILTNSVVTNNTASLGGGMYLYSSPAVLTNDTFCENTGRAVYCDLSSPFITNSILWNDVPGEIIADVDSTPRVTYSNVKNGYAGEGNLDLDPQFLAPESGDLHLMRTSPCIDAGTNEGAPGIDRDGAPRPTDGNLDGSAVVDIGAYEGFPTNLTITPRTGLVSRGLKGGPFSPDMKQYEVGNLGETALSWAVSWSASWLAGDRSSGTLQPGESEIVTFLINDSADSLSYGSYSETITFRDVTESRDISLGAVLNVGPTVGYLVVSPEAESRSGGNPGGPFSPPSVVYTLTNVGDQPVSWTATEASFWLDLSPSQGALFPEVPVRVTATINENARLFMLGSYQAYVNFVNATNDLGSTTRIVVLDVQKNASSITCDLSSSAILLGESPVISGRISPAPSAAGAFVSIAMADETGNPVLRSVVANAEGDFSYVVQCNDLPRAGAWSVQASWNGDENLAGASSGGKALTVTRGTSTVTVDAGSRAVKLGESLDISGKFTPVPDCGRNVAGTEVSLLINGPGDRRDFRSIQTNDPFGHFVLDGYTGFDALGPWTVQALFGGNGAYEGSSSDVITVVVVETAGYAVLVEGRIWSGEGIGSHNKTTNFVYEQLRLRGLLETDIRYFNYDTSQPGVAGVPTRAAVQEAVTQWARDKMNQKPANLYIVLVDHGSTDSFYIDPEVISSADLASWLTSLQNSLRGDAVTQEIVVLLGFCRSGSFLQSLGGWKRVCLASAAPDEASYKGPLDPEDPGGVRDGEFFVTEFFKSAAVGKSVYDSFREAVVRTRLFTSSGTGTPNGPYSDDARQHPLLDDNGDGAGSNLPTGEPGEDGNLGKGLYVGVSSITHNDPGDVQVTSVGETQFLGASDTGAGFWAAVSDNQRMRSLWVEVKPPGYDPPETGTDQVAMDLAAHSYDTYNQAEDRYQWNPIPEFNTSGTYQVFYFARDNLTGNLSSLKEGIVYKAKAGNQPPGAFDLLSPADGEEVPTTLALLWSDSADPEGDGITYTVEIARDEQFTEVVHRAERISETRYLVEPSAGLQDLSSYFWRVIAVDSYGAATTSNQARHFDTNNTNANFAWINSRATDSTSRAALTNAVLKADSEAFTHVGSGHYQVKLDLGGKEGKAVRLTAEAPGYTPIVTEGVVHVGKYTNKDFTLEPRSPETPTFSPPGRITTQALNVAVSCATAEAVIRYTTDGSEPTEASTSYTAPIPVSATTTLKAKAYVAGWAPSKTATATYTLVPILVISPNGGEHWTAGENRRISWKYGTGAGDTVTIELVKGDAATTLFSNVPVGSGGTGSCWWKIPVDQKAGETYRIRITGSGVGAPRDNSDAAFGILASGVQPTLTVVFPVSGTVWKRGNAPRIKWTYTGYPGPYVNIKLFRGAELVKNIVSKVGIGSGGRGFYQWRIPTSLKAGTRYRLQVTSTRTPTCTDTSDGWFTIQ